MTLKGKAMIKRMFLWVVLLVSAIAAQAQTKQRIYTKAEQEAAQKRAIEKRIEAIQDSIRSEEAFNAFGSGLSATVDVSLSKNDYMGCIYVNPNLHSNKVTLYGVLLPSEKSSVYKGRAF